MKVCVVGGGKVGFYLAKTLVTHGHTPVIIEQRPESCARLANNLDITVICGDGTTLEVLESAELDKCSALVAVTGRDENNLIACQLAKRAFRVKKTVARVNNPRNAPVLKALGVDIAVSSTDNIARLIEREVETAAIQQLMSLNGGTASLSQLIIPAHFKHAGKTLAQLTFPEDCTVVSITRGGEMVIPRGSTQILAGDKVLLLAKDTAFHTLTKNWRLSDEQ